VWYSNKMITIILLYILLCHKASLGVFWYDWALLGMVGVLGVISSVLRTTLVKGGIPSVVKQKASFFSDILPGDKKDDE